MDSLFSRYANALFSIALEENKVESYKNEVKMLKEVILENDELLHLLSSCFIQKDDKEKIIDEVFKNQTENIVNFIKVIVNNKRTNYLIKIFDEFIKTCNENLNVLEGIVYSSNKLDAKQMDEIKEALSKKLNSKVELVNLIDERLLGGVKVVIQDKIFDGSIKNKLEKLKNSLITGGN